MKTFVAVLLVCVAVTNAATIVKNLKAGWGWDNCNANDPIQYTKFDVTPDPIVIPGSITVTQEVTFGVGVTSPTQGNFTFQHYDGTQWNTLPCVAGLGSCYYADVCEFLDTVYPPDQPCPPIYTESNVPCRCPFPAGKIAIENQTFDYTEALAIPEGSYKFSAWLATDVEIACYWFTFDVYAAT